ncbi:MAG: RecX family transcriptional regulator [Clostridia bacterium]|nr:RecX family transcriptional regulator [Clostridia bacterium]
MKKVIYLKASKTEGLFLMGAFDTESGETLRLVLNTTRHPRLSDVRTGDVLDDELYSLSLYSDEEYRARKKALSLLAYSDKNELTLKRKLVAQGISREMAEDVARQMVELGYINEKRQLERLILSDASRLYGPSKILMRLAAKGYSSADIKRVMHELSDLGELDFPTNARRLVEKKYPDGCSVDERRALLYKQGYKNYR